MSILRHWYLLLAVILSCGVGPAHAQMLLLDPIPEQHGIYYYIHHGYMPITINYSEGLFSKDPKNADIVLVSDKGETVVCSGDIGKPVALYTCTKKD